MRLGALILQNPAFLARFLALFSQFFSLIFLTLFVTFLALKSHVMCYMSRVTYHLSHVMCQISHVMCQISHVTFHWSLTPAPTNPPLLIPPLATVDWFQIQKIPNESWTIFFWSKLS